MEKTGKETGEITKETARRKNGFSDSGEEFVCAYCSEIISSEIYTDRFHDYLCECCLLHLHRV